MLEYARRSVDASAGLERPQATPGERVERGEAAVAAADEDEPPRRRDRPAVAGLRPPLAPRHPVRPHVDRRDDAVRGKPHAPEAPSVEDVAGNRFVVVARPAAKHPDSVGRAHVVQPRHRVVRTRRPVRPSQLRRLHDDTVIEEGGEDPAPVDQGVPFWRDVDGLGEVGVADRIRLRRGRRLRRLLGYGPLLDADERFARYAIQQVDPSGLPCSRESLPGAPVDLDVEEHDRRGKVVVPDVVMHHLEVPAVLTRQSIERHDRRRKEVVARPYPTIEVGTGVPGREIDQPELGVRGGRLPHGAPPVHPDITIRWPGVVTELPGAGHRIEGPHELTITGPVRLDATPLSVLRPSEAGDHQAVVVERGARDHVAVLPPLALDGPNDLAGVLIEGDHPAIELAYEHFALPQRDAATGPATTYRRDRLIQIGLVRPQDLPDVHAQCEDVIGSGNEVDDAVMHDRLRLTGVLRTHARATQSCLPDPLEVRDVLSIDLPERRVPLVVQIPTVRPPPVARKVHESPRRELLLCQNRGRDHQRVHRNRNERPHHEDPSAGGVSTPQSGARARERTGGTDHASATRPAARRSALTCEPSRIVVP